MTVNINRDKCVGCGLCVNDCPAHILALEEDRAVQKSKGCIFCGHCVAVCPVQAVSLPALNRAPNKELAAEALPDNVADLVYRLMCERRSIRQFNGVPVPEAVMERLLEVARLSPSAGNRQPLRYILVEKHLAALREGAMEALKAFVQQPEEHPYRHFFKVMLAEYEAGRDPLFWQAPQLLLLVRPKDRDVNDAPIAAGRIELLAHAEGYGACFIGFITAILAENAPLRELVGLKSDEVAQCALILGEPAVRYHREVARRPLRLTRL